MVGTLRLFLDASYAIALMASSASVWLRNCRDDSDTQRSLQVAIAMFALTGALLTVRLWRIMRAAGLPPVDPAR